jgi:hypothetical protein
LIAASPTPGLFAGGRFYYVEKYFDEQDQEVRKSEAFRRWAKNVLAKAKKHLTKVGSDYYGAEAKQLLDSGEVAFEPL